MFDADVSPAADIDLEVYNSGGTLVASSGSATSAEAANILNPAAGTYTVRVVGFATGSGAASFKLHSFVLGSAAAGNMTRHCASLGCYRCHRHDRHHDQRPDCGNEIPRLRGLRRRGRFAEPDDHYVQPVMR